MTRVRLPQDKVLPPLRGTPTVFCEPPCMILCSVFSALINGKTAVSSPRTPSAAPARFTRLLSLLRSSPTNDLVRTIESITQASLNDQRFAGNRITADELPAISTEISILSDPTPTDDPASLVPGLHGIVVRRGVHSGCFLPKVASERQWSAEEFLSNCCTMKAGLAADAWKSRDTQVLLFTAEVFSDSAQP